MAHVNCQIFWEKTIEEGVPLSNQVMPLCFVFHLLNKTLTLLLHGKESLLECCHHPGPVLQLNSGGGREGGRSPVRVIDVSSNYNTCCREQICVSHKCGVFQFQFQFHFHFRFAVLEQMSAPDVSNRR